MENFEAAKSPCLRVGVTGGIGSGKSLVCRLFGLLGIPVYDADYWARWLIVHEPSVRAGIVALLGPEAYTITGEYNRQWVAGKVFQDRTLLEALNQLVHPAVERHSRSWHEVECARGVPYTIKEAALMVESGSCRHLDVLIVVSAPEELRIRRVMERDGVDAAAVEARIRYQATEAERLALADYVIENDGMQLLAPQVWRVHRALSMRSAGAGVE